MDLPGTTKYTNPNPEKGQPAGDIADMWHAGTGLFYRVQIISVIGATLPEEPPEVSGLDDTIEDMFSPRFSQVL